MKNKVTFKSLKIYLNTSPHSQSQYVQSAYRLENCHTCLVCTFIDKGNYDAEYKVTLLFSGDQQLMREATNSGKTVIMGKGLDCITILEDSKGSTAYMDSKVSDIPHVTVRFSKESLLDSVQLNRNGVDGLVCKYRPPLPLLAESYTTGYASWTNAVCM